MPLISSFLLLMVLEQNVNVEWVIPCSTDLQCARLNPHIEPY